MIQKFMDAWNENKYNLLREFEKQMPHSHLELVRKTFEIVINPYVAKFHDGTFDLDTLTEIRPDNAYNGDLLFVILQSDCIWSYYWGYLSFGTCTGCDAFLRAEGNPKAMWLLALNLLESFHHFINYDEANKLENSYTTEIEDDRVSEFDKLKKLIDEASIDNINYSILIKKQAIMTSIDIQNFLNIELIVDKVHQLEMGSYLRFDNEKRIADTELAKKLMDYIIDKFDIKELKGL